MYFTLKCIFITLTFLTFSKGSHGRVVDESQPRSFLFQVALDTYNSDRKTQGSVIKTGNFITLYIRKILIEITNQIVDNVYLQCRKYLLRKFFQALIFNELHAYEFNGLSLLIDTVRELFLYSE